MTDGGYTGRLHLLTWVLVAALAALGVRLTLLHLGSNENLRSRIEQARKYEGRIPAGRGHILDCHGNILALDLAMKNVCANPRDILASGHLRFIGTQLARVLQVDPAMVFARLNRPHRRFEYIKKRVPEEIAEQIRRMQMKGVHFEDITVRHYPQGALACHVIGFAVHEGTGGAGIEQQMDAYLRGQPGWRVGEKDGRQREIYSRRILDIAPQPGASLYLTLDQNLQYLVEKALDRAMQENEAKGAWAIVQRVRTGEILAMASRPAYDLNQFNLAEDDVKLNRTIGYVFEPGSTFKVAVIAAALNEGTVTPEDVFDCENGLWIFQGRPLRDYRPHGRLSVADILKKSSNIGAAKVALTLGEKRLEPYLRAFGFGRPTGIELPGEEAGILRDRAQWTPLSISRIAMGHEVCVTALQMLNMMCAIGNRGFLMRPALVRRVVDDQGRTIMQMTPEVLGRPIREETALLMQRLLCRVTEEGGTGTRARVEGYTVAGKTGTAQKAIAGGYSDTANVASFMGFLPAEQPELGVIVVLDEPKHQRTGGAVAAPVFQKIASQAVRYLDIPPLPTQKIELAAEKIPTPPGDRP